MVRIVHRVWLHDLWKLVALHDPFNLGLCPPLAEVPAINECKNQGRDKRRCSHCAFNNTV